MRHLEMARGNVPIRAHNHGFQAFKRFQCWTPFKVWERYIERRENEAHSKTRTLTAQRAPVQGLAFSTVQPARPVSKWGAFMAYLVSFARRIFRRRAS